MERSQVYTIALTAFLVVDLAGAVYLALDIDTTRDPASVVCEQEFGGDWSEADAVYLNGSMPSVRCQNNTGLYVHYCTDGCGAGVYNYQWQGEANITTENVTRPFTGRGGSAR